LLPLMRSGYQKYCRKDASCWKDSSNIRHKCLKSCWQDATLRTKVLPEGPSSRTWDCTLYH
ncbi:hypothetical protein J6590_103143, partial [Homalodisca vitripennis]